MTGFSSITTNKLIVGTTSATAHIQFKRESYNYLIAPKNGTIAFSPGSTEAAGDSSGTGAHLAVTYGAVIPGQNNNIVNLGSSSYKWKNVYATTFTGSLSGNASTATRLANTRTFTTNLASTTPGSFDGSANVTVGVTGVLPLSHGGTDNNLQNATKGSIIYMAADGSGMWYSSVGTSGQLLTSGGSGKPTWTTATNSNTASTVVKRDGNGNFSAGTITATLSGNASTATKWANARTITLKQGAAGSVSIDGSANKDLNVTGVSESYLTWGGKNFTGSYGPLDAAMISRFGADRMAFAKVAGITIEYSTDSGATWTDYGATDAQKLALFGSGGTYASLTIGKNSTGSKSLASYMLRITVDTGAARIYTTLNKFAIYVTTNNSSGCYCTIEKALQSTPTTYITVVDKQGISGWSGWNIINVSDITTYGNTATSQYGRLRFTFGCTGGTSNASYFGLQVKNIMGFGGMGHHTPSNMATHGHLYNWDSSQNATFPAKVTATSFAGSGASLTALNASNINAGTLAAARLPASGVTAGTYGLDAAASPAHGGKFLVPKIVVDSTGRVTSAAEYEITLPTDSNTHYTTGIRAGVSGTNSNSKATNPYIKVLDDTTYRSQIQLAGSGLTTISSDTNGKITINTSINKTNVTTALGYTPDTPAQVDAKVAALVDSAPSTLNTLNELAAALGDDANFATTVATNIGTKLSTNSSGYIKALSISGRTITYTRGDGTTGTLTTQDTNTKNTAGSSDTSSKIFLVGATSQASSATTYSHDTAYVDTNGHLYSNSKQVVNLSDSQALTNKTYNGYTLAAACAKGVTDSSSASPISSTGTSLPTERDIYYGLPTINNSHSYTSNHTIYAPSTGGTAGQYLKAVAATSAPTWASFNNLTINVKNLAGTITQTIAYNPSSAKTLNIAAADILETYIFTESKTLTTTWADTKVVGTAMTEGSYIIQVKINDTAGTGLAHYSEVYTGFLSWDAAGTNSSDYDEIVLHKAGHASNGNNIYLRTIRKASGGYLTLQICCNKTCTTATSYTITARRLLP